MSKGQRRLGRGLSSLVSSDFVQQDAASDTSALASTRTVRDSRGLARPHRFLEIPVDEVRQNPMQPRRRFDDQTLQSLAASIRDKGTLQPIVVRPADGGYELVAGERRLRATRLANLDHIPAIVRAVPDDELLELALIENIHRTDLNPIERARAYRSMHDQHGLSHDEIARRVGEDRATVTNYMRLLALADDVMEMVSSGELGVGHAKALLGISDPNSQTTLARRVVAESWSVRQLEAGIARSKGTRGGAVKDRSARPAVLDMEQRLQAALGTRVTIHEGRRRHMGKVVIEYYSLDDFERLVALLGVTDEAS
ncbi:MAG: ParB/RepB/Spo0J family partition protein [Phycisphaerae bacterium]|nr:ParB/RepB/Spo0J family partition protein [Phycisphaerae bacterium]